MSDVVKRRVIFFSDQKEADDVYPKDYFSYFVVASEGKGDLPVGFTVASALLQATTANVEGHDTLIDKGTDVVGTLNKMIEKLRARHSGLSCRVLRA